MSDKYETFYATSRNIAEVAQYVEKTLNGVSPDRIVSISHSSAMDSGGPRPFSWYSVMVVLRRGGGRSATGRVVDARWVPRRFRRSG